MKYVIPVGAGVIITVATVVFVLFSPLHPYNDLLESIAEIAYSAEILASSEVSSPMEISEIVINGTETTNRSPEIAWFEGFEEHTTLEETEQATEQEIEQEIIQEIEQETAQKIDEITAMLNQMTLREKLGQLIIVAMPSKSRATTLIEDYNISGFIFFGADITTIEEIQQLTTDLQAAAAIPLFIAVDEEGGRVSRVGRLFSENIGTALSMAQSGAQNVYENYRTIGERLALLGFNMNFAPVADIWTNPSNTVIGDRAFGREPAEVAEMVIAAVEGLQSVGILPILKHFPGHGDTYEDSHDYLATYRHDWERFENVESVPFRAGLQAGAEGVMVGHIATPLLTEDDLPAVFSEYLLTEIIRNTWQFDGLIITDALDMRGLTNNFSTEDIVISTFLAGADILLMPPNPEQTIETLLQAYENGVIPAEIFEERLNSAVERILHVKAQYSIYSNNFELVELETD